MMSNNAMLSRVEDDRVLVLERTFDAPRDLVFKMFKEPEHLKRWWGPRGWELPVCNVDFRLGGVWHYCMKCVDQNQGQFYGMESWGKCVYKEIVEPETIIYTDYFSDAEGNIDENMPSTEITLEFIDLGGKTKLVNRAEYVSAESLKTVMDMGMLRGITETWDRLEDYLGTCNTVQVSKCGYVITRLFDAPCNLVFDTWSSPEHLKHWWGPDGFTTTIQEFDMRTGGDWKFIMHGPDGTDYPNHIVFTEVVKPEKIVFWHKNPNFSATATFEDFNGRTKLTYSTQFETPAEFDQVKPYAVPGGQQTVERLGAYVTNIIGRV